MSGRELTKLYVLHLVVLGVKFKKMGVTPTDIESTWHQTSKNIDTRHFCVVA